MRASRREECLQTSEGDMYRKMILDFPQKNLVVRFETPDFHSLRRIRRHAQKPARPHRLGTLCAAVFTILLACASLSQAAVGQRWNHNPSDATLSVSTSSLAFGNVSVNTAATQSVTLTSTGSGPLYLRAAAINGSGFAVSGATFPMSLSPGQSATLTVQFDPGIAGAASGSLALVSNSSTGWSTVVGLSGTGVASATVPTLSVNAGTIAFGNVNLNSTSTQSVMLTSIGTGAVTVNSATVSGTGFSLSNPGFPLTLAPSQTALLSVQFDPTAASAASGTLTPSTDSSGGSITIGLTGTGVSGSDEVNLAWDAPASSTDPVAGYNVYRAPDGSSAYQLLNPAPVAQTAYSDVTAQSGQTYDYYVESVDASGNASVPSNMASVNVP